MEKKTEMMKKDMIFRLFFSCSNSTHKREAFCIIHMNVKIKNGQSTPMISGEIYHWDL